jgi:hypothetical protein
LSLQNKLRGPFFEPPKAILYRKKWYFGAPNGPFESFFGAKSAIYSSKVPSDLLKKWFFELI